jgi:Sap, sulfolipid-1-addressing protein
VNTLLELLLLAIASSFYPALLAVVIIFLGRPRPKRLLAFFLAGAWLASFSIGLAIVFAFEGADIGSSRPPLNAGFYLGFGLLAVLVGLHFLRPAKPKRPKKKKSGPSITQRVMAHESRWLVFVLGIVLNMPGIWYLLGLKDIGLADYSAGVKVLLLVGFNLIMFSFVEFPLVSYVVAPEWTRDRVNEFNAWLHAHGRRLGGWIAFGLGVYLIVRGIFAAI